MSRRANGEGTIYRRADGRYAAAATVTLTNGLQKRIHVYAHSRDEANRMLVQKLNQERLNVPTPERSWTVAAYVDYWLANVISTRVRPGTLEHYRFHVEHHIKPLLGRKQLATMSVADVQAAVNAMVANGKSASAIHKMRRVLSGILSHAMREELIVRNVAQLAELPRYRPKEISPWSADEASAFLAYVHGHRWESAFQCLLLYGMRKGEVIGLRWSDINFERGTFTIRQQVVNVGGKLLIGPVKTDAGNRTLPLVSALRRTLEAHMPERFGPEDLVLATSNETTVDPKNFARTFRRLIKSAGLRDVTVHATRHTAATLLKRIGVAPRDTQLILGHAHVSTTEQIYQHGDPELHRSALTAIERTLIAPSADLPRTAGATDSNALLSPLLSNDSQDTEPVTASNQSRAPSNGGQDGDLDWYTRQDSNLRHLVPKTIWTPLLGSLPTPVMASFARHCEALALGCVAVSVAVKPSMDMQRLASLIMLSKAVHRTRRVHDIQRLQQRSFPFNLLPSTPLLPPEEAHS